MRDRAALLIFGRRELLARVLGRPLPGPQTGSRAEVWDRARKHLLEEAEELYWNEMAWEQITGDGGSADDAAPEMTFPGFLTFVRALLLEETLSQPGSSTRPRPDVVEDVLRFLSRRIVELEDELALGDVGERARLVDELSMTSRLLDLVLYRYHGLSAAEVARVQLGQVRH